MFCTFTWGYILAAFSQVRITLQPPLLLFFFSESKNSDDTDLYEIPVITNASPNHSQSAESGDYAETKTPSKDDYATTTGVQEDPPLSPEVVPPPLPPRREKSEPPLQREQSVTENSFPTRPDPPERQASIKTDRPPDLPARPNLPTRSEIYNMAEKKDERSEGSVDLTGKGIIISLLRWVRLMFQAIKNLFLSFSLHFISLSAISIFLTVVSFVAKLCALGHFFGAQLTIRLCHFFVQNIMVKQVNL